MQIYTSELAELTDEAKKLKTMNSDAATHFAPKVLRDCVQLFDRIAEDANRARTVARSNPSAAQPALEPWFDAYAKLGASMEVAGNVVRQLASAGVALDRNGKFAESWRMVKSVNAMNLDGIRRGAEQIARGEFVTLEVVTDEV